jgi:hypothetical protein
VAVPDVQHRHRGSGPPGARITCPLLPRSGDPATRGAGYRGVMGRIILIIIAVLAVIMVLSVVIAALHVLFWVALIAVVGIAALRLGRGVGRGSRR